MIAIKSPTIIGKMKWFILENYVKRLLKDTITYALSLAVEIVNVILEQNESIL